MTIPRFPEGSQSSIYLSHVNYVLSNTLTLFRTLSRAKFNHVLATTVTNDRSLNKYYVLCDDAQDTMTESQFRWLDTPFSVFAVLCGSM